MAESEQTLRASAPSAPAPQRPPRGGQPPCTWQPTASPSGAESPQLDQELGRVLVRVLAGSDAPSSRPAVPAVVPAVPAARPTGWAALVRARACAGHRGQHPGPAGPYANGPPYPGPCSL